MWDAVSRLMNQAVREGITPGCALAAGCGGKVLFTHTEGVLATDLSQPVNEATRYEIGSLTQCYAVVPLTLYAVEQGMLTLDDRLSDWLSNVPEDKKAITLRQLLTHTAGFARNFLLQEDIHRPEDAPKALLAQPLAAAPGFSVNPSDIGYMLLGFLLEKVFQMLLDAAVRKYVFAPLKMKSTNYLPTGGNIAPAFSESETEYWQPGQPMDSNARFLHGVSGHGGLFTNLEDSIHFAAMLANGGSSESGGVLAKSSIRMIGENHTQGLNLPFGFGFRVAPKGGEYPADLWQAGSYGLSDPASGSFLMVSPEDGFYVVLLANNRYMLTDAAKIAKRQKCLLNAAYAAFQHEGL